MSLKNKRSHLSENSLSNQRILPQYLQGFTWPSGCLATCGLLRQCKNSRHKLLGEYQVSELEAEVCLGFVLCWVLTYIYIFFLNI